MMRFSFVAIGLIALAATSAIAGPNPSTERVPAFPGILANARYVYVASYDGDQFDPNLFPEDSTWLIRAAPIEATLTSGTATAALAKLS